MNDPRIVILLEILSGSIPSAKSMSFFRNAVDVCRALRTYGREGFEADVLLKLRVSDEESLEVYRALPGDHNDYYQARRQMVYVLQRQFRRMTDRKLLMEATQPPAAAP